MVTIATLQMTIGACILLVILSKKSTLLLYSCCIPTLHNIISKDVPRHYFFMSIGTLPAGHVIQLRDCLLHPYLQYSMWIKMRAVMHLSGFVVLLESGVVGVWVFFGGTCVQHCR